MKSMRSVIWAVVIGALPLALVSPVSYAQPEVQVGFSPEGTARALVLETLGSARQSIQMLAYSFQAPDIMEALVAAKRRGVDVRVVVDKKRNEGKTSRAAMDWVTRQGVEVRTNDRFHIHHDKTIIVDGATVETGSFNFAKSAETENSENVVVIRGMPDVARQYVEHWQSRWDSGQAYVAK
ncbi:MULTISPECIES: phospholipase D family protein [Pandoraea]|uniref:phospholipase D family nuclease n=1 Tax=Pandoraea TaxID=93217 RepID=UPI001F5D4D18|nr:MULTISPECIES: phospholipase D family protein [Pandoraea]MCI3205197.1 phospholipase D family protein [Pandoraea sp. LA3]MDN4583225.1 phospholipase D family protein [Pandoraea capi]